MVEQEKKMEEQETEHIIEEFEVKTETEIEARKKNSATTFKSGTRGLKN